MQVVGIGASAGGIEAFRLFFEAMPPDSGMAFVVVLHLSADRKSMLPEIIARWTAMPVAEAADGDLVEANRVYVIPPGHVATLRGGRLRLRHLAPEIPREPTPIDEFFDSLAAELGEDAIGVVLSGTGHDGALGLKAIKARGGLTLAQGTRRQRAAAQRDAGQRHRDRRGGPDRARAGHARPMVRMARHEAPARPPRPRRRRTRRGWHLRDPVARVGHDFSGYKDKTFLRRVQRRMQVLGLAD